MEIVVQWSPLRRFAWAFKRRIKNAVERARWRCWRFALRYFNPDRPRDPKLHEALIVECKRLEYSGPTVFRGALGMPYQLERRLRAELEATRG